ncbi:receptor-type tyrosine-protein phosphatase alpha-like [Antedon mediterranea]|uniref:receptor-type tyrosine-protein phosphatase alpha-like n=1 Tax=Antedon mediterranea TaxID=105859 RepID=UPI003AF42DF5
MDFWRLVFDYKSDVTVQLTEMEDITSALYLPKKINQKQTFGEYTVIVKSNYQNEFMNERRIVLEKDDGKRHIVQYEVNQWPKNEPVPEVDSFVKIIRKIMERNDTLPITVHCMDDFGRSGLFCLVYSVIQKMREDKMVDVFQTLKTLRSACPTAVDSEVQYSFCYDAALCYLKMYEEYANVK